jgi:hypothetical protein
VETGRVHLLVPLIFPIWESSDNVGELQTVGI